MTRGPDLSCNQITKVNNLGSLESLERLDLRSNQISDCDALQARHGAEAARLYLQLSSGKTREGSFKPRLHTGALPGGREEVRAALASSTASPQPSRRSWRGPTAAPRGS